LECDLSDHLEIARGTWGMERFYPTLGLVK